MKDFIIGKMPSDLYYGKDAVVGGHRRNRILL